MYILLCTIDRMGKRSCGWAPVVAGELVNVVAVVADVAGGCFAAPADEVIAMSVRVGLLGMVKMVIRGKDQQSVSGASNVGLPTK